jgi:hypothetical protein
MDKSDQLSDEEREGLREQIQRLMLEHRDLDDVILQISRDGYIDQLQFKRLKKRKLFLKDRIEKLKSRLLPDILA